MCLLSYHIGLTTPPLEFSEYWTPFLHCLRTLPMISLVCHYIIVTCLPTSLECKLYAFKISSCFVLFIQETSNRENEKWQSSSFCWFTPQMAMTVGAGPGRSWEPGLPHRDPNSIWTIFFCHWNWRCQCCRLLFNPLCWLWALCQSFCCELLCVCGVAHSTV